MVRGQKLCSLRYLLFKCLALFGVLNFDPKIGSAKDRVIRGSTLSRDRNWQFRVGLNLSGETVRHVGHHQDPESERESEERKL